MKFTRRIFSLVLVMCMVLSMAACSEAPAETQAPVEETTQPVPSKTVQTTEAADPKPVILAVSFGTSYNDTRDLTIGAIENVLQEAFPDYEVRRAFTAQTVIDILEERDGLEIDNVTEAMSRMVMDGVKEVIIQPTHVMPGAEYDDVMAEIAKYKDQFDTFKVGQPLLVEDADYDTLIISLADETAQYNQDGTAIVYMGHGTHHEANETYVKLQTKLTDAGYSNYFIGTVEATPSLEDVMGLVEASGAKKVVLLPLMIVAGDHATNDMAGDEEGSWKTAFEAAGYEVECVLKGLGQYDGVQQMVVSHAQAAMEAPNMVLASQIQDGTYEISVESSSNMFKIVKCVLTVESGSMSAVMTMSGDGYSKLFMGTGEEAAAASEDAYIPSVTDAEGAVTFQVPVEALNAELDCAAWSVKKEKWYDRTLTFLSDAIPAEAIAME